MILAVGVLLLSTVVSAYFLMKPSAVVIQKLKSERAPASLPESTSFFGDEQVVKKTIPFQTSLKLNCQDIFVENKGSSASVSSDHVILKLSECAKLWNNVKNVQLINKTNGYNAQLFKLSAAELNSDFIQLDKGENQLEFEISLNDGQKRSQFFKINRIQ